MTKVTLRKMTEFEFESFQDKLVIEYAAANVSTGRWSAEEAEEKSAAQTKELLPQGVDSPRVLVMTAEDSDGERIGHVWVGLDRQGTASGGAWIYEITSQQMQKSLEV